MRPIEALKSPIIPPANLGPVPELRWVAIDLLVVDDSYQRVIAALGSAKNVRAIAEEFSWLKFAPLVVSPIAGGKYAVVDGQHRATAAATIGVDSVPALIIQADSRKQAAAFVAINGNVTRMTRINVYKAQLAAGDPDALKLADLCATAGIEIAPKPSGHGGLQPGQTGAVGTLGECLSLYGRELTVLTLRAIRAADKGGALLAVVIKAAADALQDHAEWRADEQRLIAAFARTDVPALHKRAFAASQAGGGGRLIDCLYAEIACALERNGLRAAEAAE